VNGARAFLRGTDRKKAAGSSSGELLNPKKLFGSPEPHSRHVAGEIEPVSPKEPLPPLVLPVPAQVHEVEACGEHKNILIVPIG
jgi:hypothetical protein